MNPLKTIASALLFMLISLFIGTLSSAEQMVTITGQVTAEDTGEGLGEIRVRAMPGNYRDVTDEKGHFTLLYIVPGETYWISFYKKGNLYVNERYGMQVKVPNNSSPAIVVNRALKPGAAVSGNVYDQHGDPYRGAAVMVRVLDQPAWIESSRLTRTGEDGEYIILGLPEAENSIVAAAVYGHAWVEKKIRLLKGKTVGNLDFVMRWDDLTGVSGQVRTDKTQKPLINIRVALIDEFNNTIGIIFTNIRGEYSIVGAVAGEYSVSITLGDNESREDNVKVMAGRSTVVDFVVQMGE